ncbi:hypothetical protein OE88DRAFT_1803080 [Heliocybe sulcata]|uniref:UbiA prenyltransferase n=1 Tax=Heliocybe sulcata TaxID=5364 RepID=A0A5C3NG60_9AGAM|nr:hypothetical protein OE88DRAFT_1803080 [Heliocybe sulcata]
MATWKTSGALIVHEFSIFFAFSWRDWSTTLVPGSILAVAAARSTTIPLPATIFNYVRLVIWLTHYVYLVDLSNQITGVEEDRINKPDRPIPSGKVTLDGAKVRLAVVAWAFAMMGVSFPDILHETICWVLTVAFLNLTSAGNHWVGKNLVGMTTGTWALLRGAWKIMAPIAPSTEHYILAIALWLGMCMQIQDVRDTKGDAAVGRRTLPVAFGDKASRRLIAFGFTPAAFCILSVVGLTAVAPAALAMVHLYLCYRVLQKHGSRYDHKTYMIFTYLFCVVVACLVAKQHQ